MSNFKAAAPIHEGDAVYVIGGDIKTAIDRAVLEEREACAKDIDTWADQHDHVNQLPDPPASTAMTLATLIRARTR